MQHAQQVTTQPLVLNITQVSKLLNLSRTKVYALIANEGLPVVRFGRAMRVRPMALDEWLEKREQI